MKELEELTAEELREIVDKAFKELDKKGKKRTVNYRAILSSCSSRFSRAGGCSRPAGRAGRGATPTLKKNE